MRVERRTLMLLGALVVTMAVGYWNFSGGGTPSTQAGAVGAGASGRQAAAAQDVPIDVHIEALKGERPEPASSGRNPFQFRARVVAPPPPPGNTFTGITAPPVPTGPPPPPPITLKYIGLVEGAAGLRVAVLSDGRASPVYGKEGEIVIGQFRIVTIGVESIVLEYVDGRGRQTIRLSGQ